MEQTSRINFIAWLNVANLLQCNMLRCIESGKPSVFVKIFM